MANAFGFSIDRGGTFTDVCVFRPDGSSHILKLLSEDAAYPDAPTEAIRRTLEKERGIKLTGKIPKEHIAWIRMGTTVATNALLERKGEKIALFITKGFKDLLFIGNQTRPDIFKFDIQIPDVLYSEVIEVDERVILHQGEDVPTQTATNGQKVIVEREIVEESVRVGLERCGHHGIDSIVVCFLHSHIFPKHELQMRTLAQKYGIKHVSLSHEIAPMIKVVRRGTTACVDGYLTPKIEEYVNGFLNAFDTPPPVHFMQSDGGLCQVSRFIGSRAILSGPAGGVVGVARTAYINGKATIGFDMGGTSTDVCRFNGQFEHVMESTTAGTTIQIPQLEIKTVAAGGGSRLFFEDGRFVVGPESAGAHPGPVCYRKGGPLAMTDANLVLGRIREDFFPHIFGPNGDQPLDRTEAVRQMEILTQEINKSEKKRGSTREYSVEEVALGFVRVANEEMCRPIRSLTQAKGYDTSTHTLCCFGGAGGQHACAIARALGINTVFVHRFSGVLSAYGIALADVVSDIQEPLGVDLSADNRGQLTTRLVALAKKANAILLEKNDIFEGVYTEYYLHLRYDRTDCAIMVTVDWKEGSDLEAFAETFKKTYKRLFGFILENRKLIVDDIRVRAIGKSSVRQREDIAPASSQLKSFSTVKCYFEDGYLDTSLYRMSEMLAGHSLAGPAIIVDENSTLLIEPLCTATALADGNVRIDIQAKKKDQGDITVDPIRLSIFGNRFMSLAEQMGRVLQRTAISTNIKERLDFSCALFSSIGGLVANAPHIPVHLGGMQYAVHYQIEHLGADGFKKGDVILSNHPRAGGSHLPDFTVITPVFFGDNVRPVFFVANRGHHADIGGLVPGSLPPNATSLDQEGAAFVSFKVVDGGKFEEEKLIEQLMAPGKVPGCSGTRNVPDVVADVKAQIAANKKGIELVVDLMTEYGQEVVMSYMDHIQMAAEQSVRSLLKRIAAEQRRLTGATVLEAEDYMDDGTPIHLRVTINENEGSAIFDFTGTGPECMSCVNAPRAVTMSAVIYCLRCMVGKDIPLNEGCLHPVKIIIPDGSILSPSEGAAVGGGNVLTSQRLCDTILKAFSAVADSQGCMNNVMFGDEHCGYYETIGGGAGAGRGFNGRSGVHTHMTNTAITDPEIIESRYPVIVRQFGLRPGSGGDGEWRGGDGLDRVLEFRRDLSLSLLTERRSLPPNGMNGGGPGKQGRNHLIRSGHPINLGSKCTLIVHHTDILHIQSPGGGGYGTPHNGK